MHAVLAGLTTLDVVHLLDHVPDLRAKTTSRAHLTAAGGPATNAAIALAALARIRSGRVGIGDEGGPGARAAGAHGESANPVVSGDTVSLLTALGGSATGAALAAELADLGVTVLDAAGGPVDGEGTGPARSADAEPAISSIIEHPEGRMVASTNARVPVDAARAADLLEQAGSSHADPDVVLVDGHNPELAALALRLGVPEVGPAAGTPDGTPGGVADASGSVMQADPFAELEATPSHLRVLDGGSWKPAFVPLLGLVDVAVVSADFVPPVVAQGSSGAGPDPDDIAAFLRGFGITKVVRTDGPNPVRWWWDGHQGEVPVPEPPPESAEPGAAGDGSSASGGAMASTMGAGDIFHGAFAWALGRLHQRDRSAPGRPEADRGPAPASVRRTVPAPADPTLIITFANAVASLSTRSFGTRTWMAEPGLVDLVAPW